MGSRFAFGQTLRSKEGTRSKETVMVLFSLRGENCAERD